MISISGRFTSDRAVAGEWIIEWKTVSLRARLRARREPFCKGEGDGLSSSEPFSLEVKDCTTDDELEDLLPAEEVDERLEFSSREKKTDWPRLNEWLRSCRREGRRGGLPQCSRARRPPRLRPTRESSRGKPGCMRKQSGVFSTLVAGRTHNLFVRHTARGKQRTRSRTNDVDMYKSQYRLLLPLDIFFKQATRNVPECDGAL